MGLHKGQTNNPKGRNVGSKNKKTIAWTHLGGFLTENAAERAKDIMMDSDDTDFMKYYVMLLEYFKPKQARTELTGEDGNPISIQIYKLPDGTEIKF